MYIKFFFFYLGFIFKVYFVAKTITCIVIYNGMLYDKKNPPVCVLPVHNYCSVNKTTSLSVPHIFNGKIASVI